MMLFSLWFAGSALLCAVWALAGWVLAEREPSITALSARTDLAPTFEVDTQGSAA